MKSILINLAALTLSSMFFANCSTEELAVPLDVEIINDPSGDPEIIDDIVPVHHPPHIVDGHEPYDNWETLDYFPLPDPWAKLETPWNPTAKRAFTPDIVDDVSETDGWVWYSSTFSAKFYTVPIFILYNKYRGLFRVYYYAMGSTAGLEDYSILRTGIEVIGSQSETSPLLNFTNQLSVNVGSNSKTGVTLEPQPLSDATWYAFEYELAFDKDVYERSWPTFGLVIPFYMIKPVDLVVNGKRLTELNSKIRLIDSQFSYGDSYSGTMRMILNGVNDLNRVSSVLSASDLKSVTDIVTQRNYNELLTGTEDVTGSGEIQWEGNLEIQSGPNAVGLSNLAIHISGADNSAMVGTTQFYNEALGVFYLNRKPTVSYAMGSNPSHSHEYSLDVETVEYLFNPAVIESATIENIKQEIVATASEELWIDGTRAKLYSGQKLLSNQALTIQGVRVSFDVVPNDGGKPVHIVKLFSAELESNH